VDQGAGQLHPAAIAPAQCPTEPVGLRGQPQPRQFVPDARGGAPAAQPVELCVEAHIAPNGQAEVEGRLLEDHSELGQHPHGVSPEVPAVDENAAGVGHDEPGQELK